MSSPVDQAQASKAVDALLKHHAKVAEEREDTELLARDEHVWLVINTKRGSTKRKLMPKRIQLPHPPLPPPPATTVAIITKPPQRTYKDLVTEHNIKFVNRVVDTDKLRGKWKPYEARRNLMRENDLWLADERIVPSLPKLLGKMFFQAKKQPIPVNLQRKDLKAELGRAINSTYFHPSTGTSHSIRISTAGSTSSAETLANLLAAIPSAVELIEDQWDNVLSIGIKTSTSVLLPIYASKLDGRFDVKEKAAKADVEMDEGKGKGKGKAKRAAEVEEKEGKEGKKTKTTKDTEAPVVKTSSTSSKPSAAKSSAPTKADKLAGKSTGKKTSSVTKSAKAAVVGKSKSKSK